jgi:hypothetical protein
MEAAWRGRRGSVRDACGGGEGLLAHLQPHWAPLQVRSSHRSPPPRLRRSVGTRRALRSSSSDRTRQLPNIELPRGCPISNYHEGPRSPPFGAFFFLYQFDEGFGGWTYQLRLEEGQFEGQQT